jgi:hypothetical protein
MLILNKIIQCALNNENLLRFLVYMPPPSYIYAKYIDWWETFIKDYIADATKYSNNFGRLNKEILGNYN